jgi:hypothetical protein
MQFQLRTLLIVVASVAVAAAALAPWFRSLDALTQTRMAVIFGAIALENLALIGLLGWLDRESRRDSGACWKSVPMFANHARFLSIGWITLCVTSCWLLVQNIQRETADGASNYACFHDCAFHFGMLLWMGPSIFLNCHLMRVRFCENGISAGRLIPWCSIDSWHWTNNKLVVQAAPTHRMEFNIPAAARDEVNAIMLRESAKHLTATVPFKFKFRRRMLVPIPMLLISLLIFMFPWYAPRPTPTPAPAPAPIVAPLVAPPAPVVPRPWLRAPVPVPSDEFTDAPNRD